MNKDLTKPFSNSKMTLSSQLEKGSDYMSTLTLEEKMKFLEHASQVWDMLGERDKGRLEGKLEAYREAANEKKSA